MSDGRAAYYWLYILFNEREEALYVGISVDVDRRYCEHMQTQPWAAEIHSMLWLPVSDKPTSLVFALRTEEVLIKLIKPRYNKTHNLDRIMEERSRVQESVAAFVLEYM